jgi:Na+-translocating ferredoxin:NAD+ oxidoreductase subunit D
MDKKFVTPAPHIHDLTSVPWIMWRVVIALIPALIAAVWFFGWNSLLLTLYGATAAMLTEALIQKFRKIPITIADGSAFLTGMLVAYNVDANAPWWLPIMGAIFAIAIGKQVFGGLGHNPANPALLGRAFLLASWPTLMTSGWSHTKFGSINGISADMIVPNLKAIAPKAYTLITSATPLNVVKTLRDSVFVNSMSANPIQNHDIASNIYQQLCNLGTIKTLFWGNIGGCLGEISVFALLVGAAYLLYRNIIEWRIPFFYIATVYVLTLLFGGIKGIETSYLLQPLVSIFSGGLILGAFFMATDYTTSPITKTGRIIFGIGCGIFTVVIRTQGGFPEGVCYSILIMNIFTPLIDRFTIPKPFGEVKKHA